MNEPVPEPEDQEESLYSAVQELKRVILDEFEKSRLFTFIITKIFRITVDDE